MVTASLQKAQQQLYTSPAEFMDAIIHVVYPGLFQQINEIIAKVQQLQSGAGSVFPAPLADKIYTEMDDLYRKEKLVLFPYIHQLMAENRKSESCKPFKNTKAHYTALLILIIEFKKSILKLDETDDNAMLADDIKMAVLQFEQAHILFQITKDRYLFSAFKSCEGCKSLGA